MTSRSDELAEAVAEAAKLNSWRRVQDALHRYRNSAPSEETHRKVEMEVRLDDQTLLADEPGKSPDPNLPVVARLTFYLPKPAPVPEIDDVEVELG